MSLTASWCSSSGCGELQSRARHVWLSAV